MADITVPNLPTSHTQWSVIEKPFQWSPKILFTTFLTVISFVTVSAYAFITYTSDQPQITVTQAANGRNFYVSPSGSDSNSGSQAQPWKTIQFALTFPGVKPGDTILLREGVYSEGELVFNETHPQGANGNYLTIKNFPGETPELRRTSLRFKDQNFIHVEGLKFTDVFTVSLASGSQNRPISGLRFINNTFINNGEQPEPDTTHIRASTVGGQGTTPAEYVRYTDVLIQGNKIIENNSNIPDDKADALQIGGNVDYLRIIDNHLENTTSIGITIAGRDWKNKEGVQADPDDPNPDQADYVLVKGNTVKNVNGNSIYLDAPGNFVIVENNITSGAAVGIMFAGEGVTSSLGYSHGIIRNNISYNNAINSNIGGREAAHRTTGVDTESCSDVIKSRHVVMVHNTFYSTRNVAFLSRFQCAQHHRYKNNILASVHTINDRNRFYNLSTDFIDTSTWQIDYNLFYSGPSTKGFGWKQNYNGLSSFEAATGFDQHSIEADPMLTNPEQQDFSLQSNSPAIDKAGPLTFTTSAETNSTMLRVADATYFTDGYNVQSGDWIRIGSGTNASRRQIVSANYSNNTLTLHQPAAWSNNTPVSYDYAQSGPDFGALEYGYQAPSTPPPTATHIPTPSPVSSPTVLASPTPVASPIASPIASPPARSIVSYPALRTVIPPVIDGNLSEFEEAEKISLAIQDGANATYMLLWDTEALYVGATVTDTSLQAAVQLRDGNVWSDDSIELVLDTRNESGTVRDTNDYKII
nr:hypothetical protein [Candidatus Woesebacteria bacterium]